MRLGREGQSSHRSGTVPIASSNGAMKMMTNEPTMTYHITPSEREQTAIDNGDISRDARMSHQVPASQLDMHSCTFLCVAPATNLEKSEMSI